jgi:hypothetical protein
MIETLVEKYKIVDATAGPVTTNGAVTGAYISAKNAQMVWLVLQFTQAVGHATVTTITEATAVAGTGVQTIGTAVEIWSNETTAATDTLVRQTAAKTYTLTADVTKKMVVFQIDPRVMTATFDCLGFGISNSAQATDFVSGTWIILERYAQATPPTAIAD